ncbi:MAG: hypothetical protein RJB38_632 [Pseudomonadota bacterium]
MVSVLSSEAFAEQWEGTVLLEARKRALRIEVSEPLTASQGGIGRLRIDQQEYTLQSRSGLGGGRYNYSAEGGGETITLLQEPLTLARMVRDPRFGAMSFGLRNADEVSCSQDDNTLLIVMRLRGTSVNRVGNCLRLEAR